MDVSPVGPLLKRGPCCRHDRDGSDGKWIYEFIARDGDSSRANTRAGGDEGRRGIMKRVLGCFYFKVGVYIIHLVFTF